MNTLTIIGGGPGDPDCLTAEAAQAIRAATRIYATGRLAEAFCLHNQTIITESYSGICSALAEDANGDAAVIVSGDTGFYSLAKLLARELGERYRIRMIPGISSVQMLCARLNTTYEDLVCISTHGRKQSVLGTVSYNYKTLVLTGGCEDAAHILRELDGAGLGDVRVTAGCDLSLPAERIIAGPVKDIHTRSFEGHGLIVLLLENQRAADRFTRLRDEAFIRGAVPMTKESVRALACDRLEVQPEDHVADIGAGTGSVSVALSRKAHRGEVWAVERSREGCDLIRQNRNQFGAHNIHIVHGEAPKALECLPSVNKAFVGGSGGEMKEILQTLTESAVQLDVCVSAVTLENVHSGLKALEELEFEDVEAVCVNAAVSREAGGYHMMMAQNPVYLVSGRWRRWKK